MFNWQYYHFEDYTATVAGDVCGDSMVVTCACAGLDWVM